jgi:TATA-box binding protein (TBP) (component of TFIID and TFIIIB)
MDSLNNNFIESYFSLTETSLLMKDKNPLMSHIGLSTITMICDLSTSIDTKALSENFQSPDYPICTLKKTKAHDEYEVSKRGKTKKSFYNQTTINYSDHSTKSIKVFSNGRLQMTGLSSVNDARKAVNVLKTVFKASRGSVNTTDINIVASSIAMINSNFSFNVGIDIIKLKKHLEKKYDTIRIIYNPEVYPGLKIKHTTSRGISSLFVFTTGNVVITGVKSIQEIEESFLLIAQNVNANLDIFKTLLKPKENKKSPKICIIKNGYPLYQYNIVS